MPFRSSNENRGPTHVENKTYIVYQKPGTSKKEQREKIANAKEVSAAELTEIEAIQAQRAPSMAGSSTSSTPSTELIDGDLAKEALRAGKDEKEVAALLQQMKVDARRQAQTFKDKWRAYLRARREPRSKSSRKISETFRPNSMLTDIYREGQDGGYHDTR